MNNQARGGGNSDCRWAGILIVANHVVVDTGSTDRTVEVARAFGARVFDFVWVDDFAAARNAALARAIGDYAFWLDADDVVEPPERETLRALLDGLGGSVHPGEGEPPCEPNSGAARTEARPPGSPRSPEDVAAYVVRCACDPGEDGSGGETVVDHIRLFPLREGIRWTYRVHEQILPALRRAKIPVRWTDLTVRHTGYTDRALRRGSSGGMNASSARSWPSGPTIRSSCSTSAPSRSSARTGARRWNCSAAAWPARRPVIRSRGSSMR